MGELGLPHRFLDSLAVLLRPKQCSKEVREAHRDALYAFERVNSATVAAFFSIECYRVLFTRIFLAYEQDYLECTPLEQRAKVLKAITVFREESDRPGAEEGDPEAEIETPATREGPGDTGGTF